MIDIKEIEKEIQSLEDLGYINYSICNKLAMLYTIKDHYDKMAGAGASTMRAMPEDDMRMTPMRTI